MQVFEYGAAEGTPVVFFMGTPQKGESGAEFSPLASELGIRLICPTRPWYNNVAVAPSFELCTDATLAYLKQHGIERAFALGGSGGGPFALHLSTTNEAIFAACYLLASMGTPEIFVDKVTSLPTLQLLDLLSRNSYEHAIDQLGTWGLPQDLAHGAWSDFQVLLGDWSSITYSAEIPVYIHHGEADDNAPLESVRALARQLPHSTVRVSPYASHVVLAEDESFTELRTIFSEIVQNTELSANNSFKPKPLSGSA